MILQAPISSNFSRSSAFEKLQDIQCRYETMKKVTSLRYYGFQDMGPTRSTLSQQRLGHTDCKGVKIYPRCKQSSSWLIITTNGQNYCVVTKTLQRMFAVKTVLYKFNKSRILVGLYDKTHPSWDNGTSASSTICIWDSLTCPHTIVGPSTFCCFNFRPTWVNVKGEKSILCQIRLRYLT